MARDRRRKRNNPGPKPSEPHRSEVPGELDHAAPGAEAFDAALVAGAEGEVADDDAAADAELADEAERAALTTQSAVPGAPSTAQGGPRFINFLRACWAELQRVQWPDRRQVGQATAVVLGFVVVAGTYLGVADRVAQEIVDFIL